MLYLYGIALLGSLLIYEHLRWSTWWLYNFFPVIVLLHWLHNVNNLISWSATPVNFLMEPAFHRRCAGSESCAQGCCNSFVVLHSAARAEILHNLHYVSKLTKELFKKLIEKSVWICSVISCNYLFRVVCFSLGVFNQLYSKSYPAYSSSPWNVTSCFFIAPKNLIATVWWVIW